MKFIVDAQLPPALTDWLQTRGHEAHHAVARIGATATDDAIWRLAQDEHRAIITKDRDFAIWAAARRTGPQVVWLRLGNATTRNLIEWLAPRWDAIERGLAESVHLIEVRA